MSYNIFIMEIINITSALGLTPLNIVLVIMLYFIGVQSGFFPKIWKTGEDDNINGEKDNRPATRGQMNKLSNYYNHDTTQLLTSIDENLKKVHLTMEAVEDSIKELKITHQEWEKFGIPTREKK